MSNLSPADRDYLENALRLETGWIVRFTDESFSNLFSSFGIDINDEKYKKYGESKAKRMRAFWDIEDNQTVGRIILELAAFFRNAELRQSLNIKFSEQIEKIGNKLLNMPDIGTKRILAVKNPVTPNIEFCLRSEIFEHIKKYLETEDYFHAVEESYKIVRNKLKSLTNEEQAHKAFNEENYVFIFGHVPANAAEKDFFEGVKFLNMAIQKFRNEKVHDVAKPLDKNTAVHYLALASLAYDLIARKEA
jgi:uncharacterized protein (TIGR02391 family)